MTERYHLYGAMNHSVCVVFSLRSTNKNNTYHFSCLFCVSNVFWSPFNWTKWNVNRHSMPNGQAHAEIVRSGVCINYRLAHRPTWKCHVRFREHNNKLRTQMAMQVVWSLANRFRRTKILESNCQKSIHSIGKGIRWYSMLQNFENVTEKNFPSKIDWDHKIVLKSWRKPEMLFSR